CRVRLVHHRRGLVNSFPYEEAVDHSEVAKREATPKRQRWFGGDRATDKNRCKLCGGADRFNFELTIGEPDLKHLHHATILGASRIHHFRWFRCDPEDNGVREKHRLYEL